MTFWPISDFVRWYLHLEKFQYDIGGTNSYRQYFEQSGFVSVDGKDGQRRSNRKEKKDSDLRSVLFQDKHRLYTCRNANTDNYGK